MAQDELRDGDQRIDEDGITLVIAESEKPYVLSRGGVRVDHVEQGWGAGFFVSRIYGDPCSC